MYTRQNGATYNIEHLHRALCVCVWNLTVCVNKLSRFKPEICRWVFVQPFCPRSPGRGPPPPPPPPPPSSLPPEPGSLLSLSPWSPDLFTLQSSSSGEFCWILWPLCWVLNCKVIESALLILERPSEGRCLPCGPELRLRQGPDLPPPPSLSPSPLALPTALSHYWVWRTHTPHCHSIHVSISCVLFLDGLRDGQL